MRSKILIGFILVVAIIFLPTAVFLAFALMPTIGAFITDRTLNKTRTICVGALNFAGAFPFLLEFWMTDGPHTVDAAFTAVADIGHVIIIYVLAVGGYAIDMAITGVTSALIIQNAETRLKKLRKAQQALIDRWGEKVTGKYELDDSGFPTGRRMSAAIAASEARKNKMESEND